MDEFDEDEKAACRRPVDKTAYERGPTPKTLQQLKEERRLRQEQQETHVRFSSPVAQIGISFDELDYVDDDNATDANEKG